MLTVSSDARATTLTDKENFLGITNVRKYFLPAFPFSPLESDTPSSGRLKVVGRPVIGEKIATDVLDPKSDIRDPSDKEPGV